MNKKVAGLQDLQGLFIEYHRINKNTFQNDPKSFLFISCNFSSILSFYPSTKRDNRGIGRVLAVFRLQDRLQDSPKVAG
jgi:hypothetical protein